MAVYSAYTDQELLAKIVGGDHHAFKALYEQYNDKIYKFAFKIMGAKEPAEEVQETIF